METRVQRWGNSLAVRLPRSIAEEHGLVAGTEVSLITRDTSLVIRRVRPRTDDLVGLIELVSPDNIHPALTYACSDREP